MVRVVHFAVEVIALAGFFVAIGEDAQPVELRGLNELAQFFEIFLGFAGKSDDHAGADRDAGNGCADALEQFQKNIARARRASCA